MIELLALVSASLYGSADFFGGLTARRASTAATVLVSQFAGLVLILIFLPFFPGATVSLHDWCWGILAGVSGGVGVALLYHALARGRMAVVAPITAVCAAIVPVLVAFLLGERLHPSAIVGIALAFAAIALVSQPPRQSAADEPSWSEMSYSSGLLRALIAGVIIGLFFLSLARTSSAAGLWPLIAARISSVVLFGCYAVAKPGALRMDQKAIQTATAGGVLDMLANMSYMVAARVGPLSIVVTLASLYPAATVILARITLGERLGRAQMLGIICALVAVALIVAPSN